MFKSKKISDKKEIETISIYHNFNNGFQEKRKIIKNLIHKYGFSTSKDGDLVIVIGGDGTFFGAVQEKIKSNKEPLFLGLKTGNLGFLYEYDFKDLETVFRSLKNNNYKIMKHPLYEAEIQYHDNQKESRYFINDIVIERIDSRIISLNLKINFDFYTKFFGDGIIVSSSIGSSAYSNSTGGSVILDELGIFHITPISPIFNKVYQSVNKSLILDDKHHILVENTDFKNRNIRIVLDGNILQTNHSIKNIKIKHSKKFVNIFRSQTFELINHINKKIF